VHLPKEQVLELAQGLHRRGTLLILDEAFSDFLGEGRSLASLVATLPNLLVLRSLTKFFAIPGLRLGYAIGPPRLLGRLQSARDPWSVNCLAQQAGIVVLEDTGYREKTRAFIARERAFLLGALGRLSGLKPFPSAANFLLVKAEEGPEVRELQDLLGRMGILIRNGDGFRYLGPRFFRVAVRTRRENRWLIEALAQVLGRS
jgi:threonine-phosphate decarboxylase